MEQQIINNVFIIIAIEEYLKTQNHTQDSFITFCKSKDTCIGIITKIKTSPYYFNKNGKKLVNMFLDLDTKKIHYLSKNGKKVQLNCEENRIKW
jgi:hypothetical protein